MAAIERIEILRDGASAQYGSDAIAGVINIILKDDKGLSFTTELELTSVAKSRNRTVVSTESSISLAPITA